jgi:hypothetical protein
MYSNTNHQRKNNIIIAPKIPLMSTWSGIGNNFAKVICTGIITVKLVTGSNKEININVLEIRNG